MKVAILLRDFAWLASAALLLEPKTMLQAVGYGLLVTWGLFITYGAWRRGYELGATDASRN